MNPAERMVRWVDARQQRSRGLAVAFAVFKKFGDDRGSSLAALLTYYGFLAVFPSLLLMTTVLGYIGNPHLEHNVIGTTLQEFPVLGTQIGRQAAHPLTGSAFAVVVGALGLTYGALGLAQMGQHAMAQIWNVPGVHRPGFFPRLARSLLLFVVLGVGVAGTTALSSLSNVSGRTLPLRVALLIAGAAVNVVLFLAAFRTLTPKQVATRDLVTGCVAGGIGWSVLLGLGTFLVERSLRHSQELYGTFAVVLGLLGWLYLSAQLTLYVAELNVVLQRRLWPRSIVQPPLTAADTEVLRDIALQERRRPEQHLLVRFDAPFPAPAAQDDATSDDAPEAREAPDASDTSEPEAGVAP